MARQKPHEPGETLVEFQSFADSAAEWLRDNWPVAAGVLLLVVLATGGVAGVKEWREHQELEATNALATAQRDYLTAMGAPPGSYVFEEPANPETAKSARREAADRLLAIAEEHSGTSAAIHARIEAGALLAEAGNGDKAIELWRGVLASGIGNPELKAMVEVRIAQAEESAGRWSEAAQAYLEAGGQREYPLWSWALADAARCFLEAGDRDRAVQLAEQLGSEAPQVELPPHLAGMLEDLRARASGPVERLTAGSERAALRSGRPPAAQGERETAEE